MLLYSDETRDSIRDFYNTFDAPERLEYEVATGLTYPRIFGLPRGFSAGLDLIVLRDNDPAYAESSRILTLVGTYRGFKPRLFGAERPLALQLRTNVSWSDLVCNPALPRPELCSASFTSPNARVEGTSVYASVGPRVTFDLRNDTLDPSAGAYFEVRSDFERALDRQSPDLLRLEGRVNVYVPTPLRSLVLALAFRAGEVLALEDVSSSDVPVNRRFFAGGRSTVRGYPEQSLFPQDTAIGANGQPLNDLSAGGLIFFAVKSELRWAIAAPLSIAAFYDVGDVYERSRFTLSTDAVLPDGTIQTRRVAQGIGLGIRYATPVGPLALDFAVPITRRGNDPGQVKWWPHFSIGGF